MLKHFRAALLATAFTAAAVVPSFALYTDPGLLTTPTTKTIPARSCSTTQDVCYLRATINFNDNSIGSGVWAFSLPQAAYVLAIDLDVTTAFNAGTNNNLTIGATASGADFLAATSMASTGVTHLTSAAGLGQAATGLPSTATSATPTGTNCNGSLQTLLGCAVPVYIKYAQTGTAATAGVATIVITFAKNNDK